MRFSKKKTRKRPLESVKIKILKIGLRSDLSWPKVGLEPKFHDPGSFGGFAKRGQTHRQDSCFISIDWTFLSSFFTAQCCAC